MINKIQNQGLTLAKKPPEVARQTPYLSFADRNIESYAAGMCFSRHHVLWVFTHFQSSVCVWFGMCICPPTKTTTNSFSFHGLPSAIRTHPGLDPPSAWWVSWQPLEIELNETRSLLLCSITHRLSFVCFGFSHLTVQSASSHFCGGKFQGKVQFPVTFKQQGHTISLWRLLFFEVVISISNRLNISLDKTSCGPTQLGNRAQKTNFSSLRDHR